MGVVGDRRSLPWVPERKRMGSKTGVSGHSLDNSWEKSYKHVAHNHKIHLEYTNREFETCLGHIEDVLEANDGLAEYPLYVKALIR